MVSLEFFIDIILPVAHVKLGAAITVFELLIMDGVSPETC
jgi:hypothetical protein